MDYSVLIEELNIKDLGKYVIVGVSSGPDSMALLNILKEYYQDKQLVCVHINHNVRKQSTIEEQYLKEYCQANNIIFEKYKIEKYQEKNFENEARKIRYNFYEQILKKYNSKHLFLAHHGDDLIETVIMKIIRGTNLEGYAGIKRISKLENYTIVRPLIKITKEDIIKYNKEKNIKYFIDNTNEDKTYKRNRIRKEILPILKKEDKNIHLKFLRYSEQLQAYYNYLEEETIEKMQTIWKNSNIDIALLNKEKEFLKKNIIYYILSDVYNNKDNIIKEKNIIDILKLTTSNKPNQKINLPQNYIALKEYNKITIKKQNSINDYCILLKDKQAINNIIIERKETQETDGNDVCRLNSKNIKLPLYLRNKKDGDYIEQLGLNGKKKIKEIFIENKISLEERKQYPILIDSNNTILWIPNLKKSKYNVKKNDFCDIILTSYKGERYDKEKE